MASTNFNTDYSVDYTVLDNGITHAVLNVTLTNTSSQFYASSYEMQLGFDSIFNLQASDQVGAINPVITKNAQGYLLDLTFNQKAVGLGSKLPFSISFDTPSIAKHIGQIWEINIPGISNPDEFQTFNVSINVPADFGTPAYIKPYQANSSLTFTKDQLGTSGISIAFGSAQQYAFHLTYHVQNNNVFPIQTQIALPPSTNYQTVYITDITPEPSNVIEDKDGNWLALYTLFPTEREDIVVNGKARVVLNPSQQPLSQALTADYLSEKQYWQVNNIEIRALANQLRTPQAIYNYVVKTLHYDFSRVSENKPRLGALAVLQNPSSAVCLEFTDLFIALSRAAGIPAREVDGFAYTQNTKQRPLSLVRDILHAWPEYYDTTRKTWIMVDPTWGNTTGGVDYFNTMDFDHLAFVVKGEDSTYPLPPGDYTDSSNPNPKDVQVTFTSSLPSNTPNAEIIPAIKPLAIAGFPIKQTLTIENLGPGYLPPQLIYLTSSTLTPQNQIITSNGIPPYGRETIPYEFNRTSFLTNQNEGFTIQLTGKTFTQRILVLPIYLTPIGIGGIIIGILAAVLFIITHKIRRLHLFR